MRVPLLADALLLAAAGCAVATLPPELVPLHWIAGYALPALLLLLWQRLWPRRQGMGVLAATAALLGVGAVLRSTGPATEAAPIACILVAPLTYFCLRGQPGDRRYALFLALCVLVVGSVLDLPRARCLALGFAVGSAATLLGDAALMARGTGLGPRAGTPRRFARWRHGAAVVGIVVLTALSLFQVLTVVPTPARAEPALDGGPARRSVPGLSERFDLSPSDGWLETVADLRAPRLAAVKRDGGPLPENLYLRFVHFDLAGANRWATARYLTRPQPQPGSWTLLQPAPEWRTVAYTIEREPMANGQLLLPECTWRVEGVFGLQGHEGFGLLQETHPAADTLVYRALASVPGPNPPPLRIDPQARHLLSLPEALYRGDVAQLAARYGGGIDDDLERALAIARRLQRDYRYSRRDPSGPWPDVLHNFLFHARAGYCMHFASALAVMLRLQRVPCRIGAGLYGGHEDGERPGWRVFGAADAHAWVEVPCLGVGWVVIDATPAEGRATSLEGMTDVPVASAPPTPEPTAAGADEAEPLGVLRWPLAAAFLIGLLLTPLLRRTRPHTHCQGVAAPPATPAARRLLAALLSRLAQLGLERRRHETLRVLATRARAALAIDGDALDAAFSAYEEVRFGGAEWSEVHGARMRAGLAAAVAARSLASAASSPAP